MSQSIHINWVSLTHNGPAISILRKGGGGGKIGVKAGGGSAAGKPCKQGQTAKYTGCIPRAGRGVYKGGTKGSTQELEGSVDDGEGSDRPGSRPDASGVKQAGGRVEGEAKGPGTEAADKEGAGQGASPDHKSLEVVNQRIDRYSKVFKERGDEDAAEWMKALKEHINKVGVDDALEALGEQRKGGFEGKVQYEGAYDEVGDTQKETDFIHRYLEKAGVVLIHGNTSVDPNAPLVSGWSEANLKLEGRDRSSRKGKKDDYIPTEATFKDKLEETQHLPGLESTQDINDAVGQNVTHFTPDVLKKLDAKYGRGEWIVKSYGEDAYAGFGVLFPQRVKQIKDNARSVIASARDELKEHGYRIARNEDGMAIGLSLSGGRDKKLLHFGGEEFDSLPKDIKILGKQVQQAAPSEKGTRLPTSVEDALQNNYGVTLRRGKDGVPNGVVDWDGREHALDSKHVAVMSKRDSGAMGHELHRALESDEARRESGYSGEPKYMVGPAFRAIGVSAEDRAAGATWETANEGRVHCVTRDGKATVVPYATLAGRADSMPAVFATRDVRAMERTVEDTINGLPVSERSGQLYAPDVVKTKDGWRVIELNPSAAGGGSDWLGRNPFVIDAIASHAVGREPMHARFIRGLLDKGKGVGKKTLKALDKGTPSATPEVEGGLASLNPGLDQPLERNRKPGAVVSSTGTTNYGWIPLSFNMAEDQSRDAHGRFAATGSVGGVRKVRLGNSTVSYVRSGTKKIDGDSLGLPNYKQKDDHSCSFVASLAVVHYFDDEVTPTKVLKAVRPTKKGGLTGKKLQQGLKKLGIKTEFKDDLTISDLRQHVKDGTPVMVTVYPKDWSSDHWTVVEGFSGNRIHLSNYKSLPIRQFMKEWYEKGEGLVCSKKGTGTDAPLDNMEDMSYSWIPLHLTD